MSHSVRVVVDSCEYSLNYGTTVIHCLFSDTAALFQSEICIVTTIIQSVFSDKYYMILCSAYVKKESIFNR